MIDLRNAKLPDCLEVDGEFFDINTDFRVWLRFGTMLEEDGKAWYGIFSGDVPSGDEWARVAIEFYNDKNDTPKIDGSGGSGDRAVDFILDGEYIAAAFQQAYGIDLTNPSTTMHWHRFMALFRGLPEDTMMSNIMGYRTWRKSKKKHDERMRELKRMWRLPDKSAEAEKERVLKLFNEMYG